MNIKVPTGNTPQPQQAAAHPIVSNTSAALAAQQKIDSARLSRVNEENFEHFKETMPDGKLNEEMLQTLRQLEQASVSFNRKLQFIVDSASNQVLIKVIDAGTGKLVKVLPPKELQRLSRRARENSGLLLDETV